METRPNDLGVLAVLLLGRVVVFNNDSIVSLTKIGVLNFKNSFVTEMHKNKSILEFIFT